jgi:hypothetical protein
MIKIRTFFIFIFFSLTASAQIGKIDTDRPDQTESVFTVPAGWLQGELGFAKERFGSSPYIHNSWTLPTLLTRYGISQKWELRLLTEYNRWGNEHRFFKDTIGLLPVELGFKVNLVEENGIIPRISLIGQTGFNRLSSRLTNGHYGSFFSPGLSFTFQNSLSDKAALGYNIGVEWEDTQDEPATWFYTFAPGFELGEKWYAYIEVFGFFRKYESPEHILDGGIAYYINENNKVDASAGFRITPSGPKNYVALGFSFRFKVKKVTRKDTRD